MKLPPLVGIFPSQFPGWGRDERPVTHPVLAWDKERRDHVPTGEEKACEMAFHPPGSSYCQAIRYIPVGVSGIDRDGRVWVLVNDSGIELPPGADRSVNLRWVVFPVEVGL